MKLSEIPRNYHILVLGSSGTGKTHLIGSLCQRLPTLIVTADPAGLDTLAKMGVDADVLVIKGWQNVMDYYEKLRKGVETYKAVAIDDLSAVQQQVTTKVIETPRGKTEEHMSVSQRQLYIFHSLLRGERRLVLGQFNEIYVAVNTFVNALLELPYRVKLFTALEGEREHPRTGLPYLYPDLIGGMRSDILARFSLVANSFVHRWDGVMHWCLSSRPHPRIPTKDRYATPRTWLDPTAERLLKHIMGKEEQLDTETNQEQQIGLGDTPS